VTAAICLKGRKGEFGPTLELAPARDIVYVGRVAHQGGWKLRGSMFANPFRAQRVGGAQKAVDLYREWLRGQPALVALAREKLRGKRLGCWCASGTPCHAVALAEIADGARP
jgi:hypothetical protein